MSKLSVFNRPQGSQSLTLMAGSKPSMPFERKQPTLERRIADPSSSIQAEKRYPIPSFFEYRARPKEFDSL